MADFDYTSRKVITNRRTEALNERLKKVSVEDKALAKEIAENDTRYGNQITKVQNEFMERKDLKPSRWFDKKGLILPRLVHQGLLDAFVPKERQASYLYIIDKLNQFPYSRGYYRRTMRTAEYWPSVPKMFAILRAYEKLFYIGENLETYILKQKDPEMLDYVKNNWNFDLNFSYLYAAEIDRGNQAVIEALKTVILSENQTAYLDREMILGILRSDNAELHQMICSLLLAARLQEGIRQAISETMDEGTIPAFRKLLTVIQDNNLIRFSSVQRAVSTWIGIFDEKNVDRINGKILELMGKCLCDPAFLQEQLATDDAIAINVALWALAFTEAGDAMKAMEKLIRSGTRPQKLAAGFFNDNLQEARYKQRVAKQAILANYQDLEIVSLFLSAYTSELSQAIMKHMVTDPQPGQKALPEGSGFRKLWYPKKPILTEYFNDEKEALLLYDIFWNIYRELPKKGREFNPCVFPWYRAQLKPGTLVRQMAFMAYLLEDEEKITEMAGLLNEVDGDSYDRARLINLLLFEPKNTRQRELLIGYMGNAETNSSEKAVVLAKRLKFTSDEYELLEHMLRFKRSGLRAELIGLLMDQNDEQIKASLQRLLQDKKEEKRSAGLDIILRLSKEESRKKLYQSVRSMTELIAEPTDKERILIDEIGGSQETKTEQIKGFGIYDPDVPVQPEKLSRDAKTVLRWLPITENQAIEILKKLDQLIDEYKEYEYTPINGDKELIGNRFDLMKREGMVKKSGIYIRPSNPKLDEYPLAEELRKFYEKEIKTYDVLCFITARWNMGNEEAYRNGEKFYKIVFGKSPFKPMPMGITYSRQIGTILNAYRNEFFDAEVIFEPSVQVVQILGDMVSRDSIKIPYNYSVGRQTISTFTRIHSLPVFSRAFSGLSCWSNDEEFIRAFHTAWRFELRCKAGREKAQFLQEDRWGCNRNSESVTGIRPYWFLKAYHLGVISKDMLMKSLFEYFSRQAVLGALCQAVKGEYTKPSNRWLWNVFFGHGISTRIYEEKLDILSENNWCGRLMRELYDEIVPVIVDTELRRGEAETIFSEDMSGVDYIQGTGYLVRILMALGKDTLGRDAYYSWYFTKQTKKDVLSRLLRACYPAENDSGETLKKTLEGTKITQNRLIEVAMYAPQWVDVIQEAIGWQGLKSGCYYFMAHMNECFDDQKKAMIAKYTPLTPEELQDGGFDRDWFMEAYEMLGEKNFSMLYQAAKYISDGIKHSRARKYADAATGKVELVKLREEIVAKRNKDLLMSYGLVPFAEDQEKDMLNRYQFIQQFRKESRQFGAQRRASETKAADIALVNMSVHAGFSDVTRLTLRMESRLAAEFAPMMEWTPVEDVEICLQVDESGKAEILCRKQGKVLKSLPSRLGKLPYVLEVKDAHKKLKDQYVRTKKLMEESMEGGAEFTAQELCGLWENPFVKAILEPLVFLWKNEIPGFLKMQEGTGFSMVTVDGEIHPLTWDSRLIIAHPLHLYKLGCWHEFQKYLFDHQVRQPFKQVFRELYVKLPEEMNLQASRMFAGNQIQPQKTLGCLKNRRWVADYDEGLQKVYYKENIIARIYALADWFSPADVEAPTLEWVEFSDRKTFASLKIEDVPELIYSEVMRDVDLAVSVAHAGGVDPETSHSTIEMRRAIVEFNLPLFGLTNVTLRGSHAIIKGSRAVYNVHLGSGVVHQEGGAMIHILPVHSQKRGKLFLPFVDEDPKTAEIMSKIVLLAEDKKLKDPFILDQIK